MKVGEPQDEPPWLTAKVDQRLALMVEKTGGKFPEGALVAMPLTEPDDGASQEEIERWDRSCDNCGKFIPLGELLYTGSLMRELESGQRVLINFGACATCVDA